jgi:RecA/RadA recombinase
MNTLEEVNKKVNKEFPNLVLQGESLIKYNLPRIPTGLFIFDLLTGGGILKNKYIKFWGPKASSKTVFALICAGSYQRLNPERYVLLIDYENAFEPDIASLVMDVNRLILVQPEYAEQGIELHKYYLQAQEVGFVIVDSLGYMTPLNMAEAEATKDHVGDLTKVVNKMFRQCDLIIRNALKNGRDITTILISQVRANIGGAMFAGDSVAGGKLSEHMPSMEVKFYSDLNKKKTKNNYKFTVVKNRGGVQRVSGAYSVIVKDSEGLKRGDIDQVKTVLTYAKRVGVLEQSKTKLVFEGNSFPVEELIGNKALFNQVKDATLDYYLTNNVSMDEEDTTK